MVGSAAKFLGSWAISNLALHSDLSIGVYVMVISSPLGQWQFHTCLLPSNWSIASMWTCDTSISRPPSNFVTYVRTRKQELFMWQPKCYSIKKFVWRLLLFCGRVMGCQNRFIIWLMRSNIEQKRQKCLDDIGKYEGTCQVPWLFRQPITTSCLYATKRSVQDQIFRNLELENFQLFSSDTQQLW